MVYASFLLFNVIPVVTIALVAVVFVVIVVVVFFVVVVVLAIAVVANVFAILVEVVVVLLLLSPSSVSLSILLFRCKSNRMIGYLSLLYFLQKDRLGDELSSWIQDMRVREECLVGNGEDNRREGGAGDGAGKHLPPIRGNNQVTIKQRLLR